MIKIIQKNVGIQKFVCNCGAYKCELQTTIRPTKCIIRQRNISDWYPINKQKQEWVTLKTFNHPEDINPNSKDNPMDAEDYYAGFDTASGDSKTHFGTWKYTTDFFGVVKKTKIRDKDIFNFFI